jgi:hypothetical protein
MRRVFPPSIVMHKVDTLSTNVHHICCNETNWPVLFHKYGQTGRKNRTI